MSELEVGVGGWVGWAYLLEVTGDEKLALDALQGFRRIVVCLVDGWVGRRRK